MLLHEHGDCQLRASRCSRLAESVPGWLHRGALIYLEIQAFTPCGLRISAQHSAVPHPGQPHCRRGDPCITGFGCEDRVVRRGRADVKLQDKQSTSSLSLLLCDQALAAFAAGLPVPAGVPAVLQCGADQAPRIVSKFCGKLWVVVRSCALISTLLPRMQVCQCMSQCKLMLDHSDGPSLLQPREVSSHCRRYELGAPAATSRSTEAQCAFDARCRSHPEYACRGFAHWQWKPVSAPLGRHLGYCASCPTQRPVFDPEPFTAAKWCSGVPPRLKDLAGPPGLFATQASEDGDI